MRGAHENDRLPPPRHNYSALILDDHSGIRRIVASAFAEISRRSRGDATQPEPIWRVETASSFDEAMEKLSPDIGIAMVDIHLGDDLPDGIEFVEEARAIGYRGFVCMLTAYDDTETLARALIAGADDYLLKSPDSLSHDSFGYVISRASGRLGLENRYQLVALLTVLSGYGARYRTAGRGEG